MLVQVPAALAERAELQPLVWALDRDACRSRPAARDAYRATLAHNLLLGAALDEALDVLVGAEVPVQPLKGALFVETLYGGDSGARPMGDLDLLVPPDNLERAQDALVRLGYEPFGLHRARWSKRFSHHRILRRGPVTLELHWKLCHELAIDGNADAFFLDAQPIAFRGRPLMVARDELQLYYILVHAATHGLLHSAVWIIDARLLAGRHTRLDWDYIEQFALAHRAARAVRAAARVVNAAFPGTLPLPRARAGSVRDQLLDLMLASTSAPVRYGTSMRSLAIRSLLTDRVGDAGRALWEKALLRVWERLE